VKNCAKLYQDVIEQFLGRPAAHHAELTEQYQPEWQCWEPGTRWVRQPPPHAITDPGYFSFITRDEL
jgi:predicted phosphoadenosine phosphosulfate sulfurtransferase